MRKRLTDLPAAYQSQALSQLYGKPLPDSSPPAPKLECRQQDALSKADAPEASHSGKCVIRVTSFRRTLLDEDNLCEKFHIDALRYAGVIPSDAPDLARIITTQKKVRTKDEERTEIEVSYGV